MDQDTILWTGVSVFCSILLGILVKVNHHRLRSNCCGKILEASIDVENTTPKKTEPIVNGNR
jgi:hypothetical protein